MKKIRNPLAWVAFLLGVASCTSLESSTTTEDSKTDNPAEGDSEEEPSNDSGDKPSSRVDKEPSDTSASDPTSIISGFTPIEGSVPTSGGSGSSDSASVDSGDNQGSTDSNLGSGGAGIAGSGGSADGVGSTSDAGISCSCATNDACCDGCIPKNDGGNCLSDNIDCTNDVCRGGTCAHELESGYCLINGSCFEDADTNPQNSCQYCDTLFGSQTWRSKGEGTTCDDGLYCNGEDTCASWGTCGIHTGDPCADGDPCRQCDETTHECTYLATMTWYDSTRGLTWQLSPFGSELLSWEAAINHCSTLVLCGQSGWRLPTISELRSLIRGCSANEIGGSCGVTDSCTKMSCDNSTCPPCILGAGPAGGSYWVLPVEPSNHAWFWSSSPVEDDPNQAWLARFNYGNVGAWVKTQTISVRCVRN